MITACIISFIIGAMIMMCTIGLMSCQKDKKPRNKVHFYMVRDKSGILYLYLNKPFRHKSLGYWYQTEYDKDNNVYIWKAARIALGVNIGYLGLNPEDFKDLRWEDEPVEVFLNLE